MPGTFILSLDAELAWGTLDKRGFEKYRRHLHASRQSYANLLLLLEQFNIPATWAFVGHLFLSECQRERFGADPHPDALTAPVTAKKGDWHRHDPGTNRLSDPFWYGDDLIDMVLNSNQGHEVGCHTFSHIPLDESSITSEIAESQLSKCQELASCKGLELRSLVFPRNIVGHVPILARLGFDCYRGPEHSWYTGLSGKPRRIAHFAHRLLGLPPPVYKKMDVQSGVVNIPASMFLMPSDGIRSIIPARSRIRQAIHGLTTASKSNALFHLWFHPWNLGGTPEMLTWLSQILEEVARLRSKGLIQVRTMGDLGKEILNNGTKNLHSS